jgi:hypothetical protein
MAKAATPVNREKLVAALQLAEANGPLASRDALWRRTAELYNGFAERPISFSVVGLRVKEWGLSIQTQAGRRGAPMTPEHKAALAAGRGERVPRAEKLKAYRTYDLLSEEMSKDEETARFLPVVEAARKGSIKAAIKLQCLDCSNWQPQEIRECVIESCPMFPHRPYQVAPQPGEEESDGE